MIPTIGLMIGFYIITRSFEMIGRSKDQQLALAVRVFSVISIIISIIGMFDLFTRGSSLGQ